MDLEIWHHHHPHHHHQGLIFICAPHQTHKESLYALSALDRLFFPRKNRTNALTVRVALLADPVHPAVRVDPKEVAAVFAVQALGLLEVPRSKASARPVVRWGRERGDSSRRHLSLFRFLRLCPPRHLRSPSAASPRLLLPLLSPLLPALRGATESH